ncbi:MAG: PilZ domain-containing protein [Oscillospiraceae bacterium]|nr:PilZ domain-containing protein [Oscillospiraceae bacterium]
MSALTNNFTGCSVVFYSDGGDRLGQAVITSYDKEALTIEADKPPAVTDGTRLEVLILTSPVPVNYRCKAVIRGRRTLFALHSGKEKNTRQDPRHKLDATALVTRIAGADESFKLAVPFEVKLSNISKAGVRFRAPRGLVPHSTRILLQIDLGGKKQLMVADVVNFHDTTPELYDYGCRFVAVTSTEVS